MFLSYKRKEGKYMYIELMHSENKYTLREVYLLASIQGGGVQNIT